MLQVATRGDRGRRALSSLCLMLLLKSSLSSAERYEGKETTGRGKVKFMSAVSFHSMLPCLIVTQDNCFSTVF